MKTKYIATAALAAGITYNANAQKDGFVMYNTDFSDPAKSNNIEATAAKLNLDATYLIDSEQFGAEASLQGHLGRNFWLGPYAKTTFGKINENSLENFEKTTHIFGDLYSQTEKETEIFKSRENPLELGLKFSKGFGPFEAGVGFGYDLVKEKTSESTSGVDRTMQSVNNQYNTLEEKPFTMQDNNFSNQSWNPTINAEIKLHPTRWSTIGIQGKFDLKDKRPEIMAKIGFQFGGKRRR